MKFVVISTIAVALLMGSLVYMFGYKRYALAQSGDSVKVVELFTSQSCSSCPPADKHLEKIAKRDDFIALSCNVTYWNYLHWEDTLSQEFCTERQRFYSYHGERNGRIFTPEMIVNGDESVVGSVSWKVNKAISDNRSAVKKLDVFLVNNKLEVSLPDLQGWAKNNVVSLVSYGGELVQKITSGENRGRTVKYTNPVLGVRYISDQWDGKAIKFSVDIDKELSSRPVKGYAILVHSGTESVGHILAAGKYEL